MKNISPDEDKRLVLELLCRDESIPANVKQRAKEKLFTERWTVTPDLLKQIESSIQSYPLNSEPAAAQVKRLFAFAAVSGSELIQARVNVTGAAYIFQVNPAAKAVIHWESFDYENAERFIKNSDLITDIFGYWPTFHDAEVLALSFDRGTTEPEKQFFVLPFLTVKVEHWELTSETGDKGFLVLRKRTVTALKFHGVQEVRMENFNHQNAIFGLRIQRIGVEGRSIFAVRFEAAHGLDASFRCSEIVVLEVNSVLPG